MRILFFDEADEEGEEEEQEEEGADAAGDVSVCCEEGDFVAELKFAAQSGAFPPRALAEDFAGRGYEGTYAGVAAAGNGAAGLDGTQAGIAQMLPVARSVSPPGVICDDGQGTGSFAHVAGAVFSVDGFIADSAAEWNFMRSETVGISEIEQADFVLSDTAPHHSAEQIVDFAEYCRQRSLLDSHYEAAFMENVRIALTVNYQG